MHLMPFVYILNKIATCTVMMQVCRNLVCMCGCTYICILAYICIHTNIYMHTYKYIYICIICICIVCQYLHNDAYVYLLNVFVFMCVYVHANILVYMWTCTHVYDCAYMCLACVHDGFVYRYLCIQVYKYYVHIFLCQCICVYVCMKIFT